ncbi:MAG: hypothetical protein HYV97_00940 [Bdellovibrio sp.]|nr:hypothetical protein [Bdellovibrio sp.]
MKFLLMVLLLVSFVHCASNPNQLTEDGKKVQVIPGKKPMEGCEVVDKVIGENDIGSIQVSTNKVRNAAAKKGANYVLIEDEILNGGKAKVIATAYTCTE